MRHEGPKGKSLSRVALRKILRDRLAVICFFIILLYIAVAIVAACGLLPPLDTAQTENSYRAPGSEFLLGTDILGRSVLLKILHGARIAMTMGLLVTLIAIPLGVLMGAVGGYFGGRVDALIVWIYTTFTSVPSILLLVAVSYVLGKGLVSVCFAIGVVSWVGTARLVRGEYMKQRSMEYVEAAKSLGATRVSIIFKHILPNVMPIVLIQTSLQFVYSIKSEVILTFIGVGIQNQSSWGAMISDAKDELARGIWWQFVTATAAMMVIVFAFNYFNDVLRDALDPRLQNV